MIAESQSGDHHRVMLIKKVAEGEQAAPGELYDGTNGQVFGLLVRMLTIRFDTGEWKEISKGAFVKRLFVDKARNTVTSLHRLLPGARLPAHRHLGIEECLVIEGDYHINDEVLGAGDYHCALP